MKQQKQPLLIAAGAFFAGTASAQSPVQSQSQFQWLVDNPGYVTNTLVTHNANITGAPTLCTGDLDGDNDVDVLHGLDLYENGTVLGPAPTFGLLTSDTGCAVDPFLSIWADSELGDFDGDGLPEIVAVGQQIGVGGTLVGVWRSIKSHGTCNTTVRFRDAQDPAAGGWSTGFGVPGSGAVVEVADFDNDGDLDFVTGYSNGAQFGVMFYRNTPVTGSTARSFLSTTPSFLGIAPTEMATGDFDGDGRVDLAIGGGTLGAGQYMIAQNVGGGRFVPSSTPFPAPTGFALSVAAADVDGDSDTDLVWGLQTRSLPATPGNWFDGGVHVFANNGAGTFTLAQHPISPDVTFTDLAVGDIDEDGLVDIVGSTWREQHSVFFPPPTFWVTFYSTCGTRAFVRPSAGAPFADDSAARIGVNPWQVCFDALDPIIDAKRDVGIWGSCADGSANAIQLADIDLDLDLDILVAYQFGDLGVFNNMLWHVEAPRSVAATQNTSGTWQWDIPYDHYHEFNLPNFGNQGAFAVIAATFTPPQHVFPAVAGLGVVTNAPYVFLNPIFFVGQGRTTAVLGPYPTPAASGLIGTHVYATSLELSVGRNELRITNVVDTVLQ